MKYAIFPDMEAIAATALINQGVCDGKVYSSRPKDASEKLPIAIVQRLGGLPTERHSIDAGRIQVDVWGRNKSEARREAEAARRSLHESEGVTFPSLGGYITACEDETGLTFLPDPDTKEDRYIFGVTLSTRATAGTVT